MKAMAKQAEKAKSAMDSVPDYAKETQRLKQEVDNIKKAAVRMQEFLIDTKEYLEGTPHIPESDRDMMGRIAGCYVDDTGFLSRVYEGFMVTVSMPRWSWWI